MTSDRAWKVSKYNLETRAHIGKTCGDCRHLLNFLYWEYYICLECGGYPEKDFEACIFFEEIKRRK